MGVKVIACRSNNQLPFELTYKVSHKLGQGGFATVFAGVRVIDGTCVAIKRVLKNKVTEWTTLGGRKVPMELKLLHSVQNVDGVIKLLNFYERNDSFIYVMERPNDCKDMFDFINENKYLEENLARQFFHQIVQTVLACHSMGIIHRDIKDENILVETVTQKLKLIDFGSGALVKEEAYTDFHGTREYAPPRVVGVRKILWGACHRMVLRGSLVCHGLWRYSLGEGCSNLYWRSSLHQKAIFRM